MTIIFGKRGGQGVGGVISTFQQYTIHTFTTSGTYTHPVPTVVDILLIGGGGTGGTSQNFGNGGGGGGAATLLVKFVGLSGSTPYPVIVGGSGSPSSFNSTIIVPAGGTGAAGEFAASPSPTSSGGGGSGWTSNNPGGTGANIYGVGFPGFAGGPPGGGGGGAGSGGPITTLNSSGGNGVPIAYFTGDSVAPFVCFGGPGPGSPTAWGSGGFIMPQSNRSTPPPLGTPGAVFIRYMP